MGSLIVLYKDISQYRLKMRKRIFTLVESLDEAFEKGTSMHEQGRLLRRKRKYAALYTIDLVSIMALRGGIMMLSEDP